MKIALISSPFFTVPPTGYGGLEQVVADLFVALVERGHKVVLFAPKGSQVPPGGFVYETGEPLTSVNVDWLGAEEKMWNVYKDNLKDFDIINSHDWFGFCYASKIATPSLRIAHTHHGGLNAEWWLKSKPPYKLNFIAISNWMTRVYASQNLPSKFVYNGINLERYQFKKEKGDRLLFVGRFDSFKQPHLAIEIARTLGMSIDLVGGTFVSDVAYLENLKRTCNAIIQVGALPGIGFDMQKQVVMYPDASHETKVSLMQNAKCLIFPSNMGEPFGLVAAEAMACGAPVVSTSDGAIGEVVQDGVTGFVCKSKDEMIEAVKKVGSISPEACRRRVEENFSRQVMARGYEKLYREILEGSEW